VRQLPDVGYDSVTFGSVGRELGISKGLISYHFPQREDLMAAAVEKIMADFAASFPDPVPGAPAADNLRVLVASALDYAALHATAMAALLEIGEHWRGPAGRLLAAPWRQAALQTVEETLRQGQESGDFAAFDCHLAAIAIQGILDGQVAAWRREPPEDATVQSRMIVGLIERMVRK
jgi:TetR/AcrR family transcriptional regulator, fatty acid metabolism regulator protein